MRAPGPHVAAPRIICVKNVGSSDESNITRLLLCRMPLTRSSDLSQARDEHRQITEAYLLLLAVENGGRLVTFDREVPLASVRQAEPDQVVVLG